MEIKKDCFRGNYVAWLTGLGPKKNASVLGEGSSEEQAVIDMFYCFLTMEKHYGSS